jgi:hypothetical protein
MQDQMADLVSKCESQPVFFATIFIDVLINANALKVLGQETVDIDLLEQTEDGDGSESQLKLDDLYDWNRQKAGRIDMGRPEFLGFITDLCPRQPGRTYMSQFSVPDQLRLIF